MKMEKKVTRKCDLCGSWGTISRSSKGRSLSHVLLFATPWTAAHQASLSFTVSWSLLKLLPIESMMPSTIASSVTPFSSCPQSLPASGSFPTSWLFTLDDQNIGALASVLSMNIESWFPLGFTGLIFLSVHGTLKSLLQHNLKASVLWRLAFFMVQLSYLYMTTGKTVTLTIPLLAVMSLLSNMLSRFVWRRKWQSTPVFMPREFHGQRSLAGYSPQGCKKSDTTEWISTQVCHSFTFKEQASFNFMSAVTFTVILEPKKIKSATVSIFSPSK